MKQETLDDLFAAIRQNNLNIQKDFKDAAKQMRIAMESIELYAVSISNNSRFIFELAMISWLFLVLAFIYIIINAR